MLTMKHPHTAQFVAPFGVGKTHLALDLLEHMYFILNILLFSAPLCNTVLHTRIEKGFGLILTSF